jgi:hypothetical protein
MLRVEFVKAFPEGTSRGQGESARKWLRGLVDVHSSIELDLSKVEVMTPSFADECFGKLLKELGEKEFRNKIRLLGASESVRLIVNYVLRLRLSETAQSPEAVKAR